MQYSWIGLCECAPVHEGAHQKFFDLGSGGDVPTEGGHGDGQRSPQKNGRADFLVDNGLPLTAEPISPTVPTPHGAGPKEVLQS